MAVNESRPDEAKPHRWPALIALVALTTVTCGSEAATNSDEVLLQLAAETDRLREEQRQAAARWRDEAARLRVVEQSLADEFARLEAQLASAQEQRAAIASELSALRASAAEEDRLAQQASALSERLRSHLAGLRHDSRLAIHQIGDEAEPTRAAEADSAQRLATAFEALARAERQSRSLQRRRLSGLLPDGRRLAAEVLAVGGAAAWWAGTDGSGGVVRVVDGDLRFDPVDDPELLATLHRAFAIHSGEAGAAVVALPVPEDDR